jgi:hypothetical protein
MERMPSGILQVEDCAQVRRKRSESFSMMSRPVFDVQKNSPCPDLPEGFVPPTRESGLYLVSRGEADHIRLPRLYASCCFRTRSRPYLANLVDSLARRIRYFTSACGAGQFRNRNGSAGNDSALCGYVRPPLTTSGAGGASMHCRTIAPQLQNTFSLMHRIYHSGSTNYGQCCTI